MNNFDNIYWETYYQTHIHDIYSSFAQFVYEKYIKTLNQSQIFLNICDLGAGNCRDSIYLWKNGNKCKAIDITPTEKINGTRLFIFIHSKTMF
jgi:2-polyprenyl-3-methyl-5-hydroxy-6-metoxy-1,4-benzoquinol methylase